MTQRISLMVGKVARLFRGGNHRSMRKLVFSSSELRGWSAAFDVMKRFGRVMWNGSTVHSHTNMAEFPARGGCPCTDKKQFPELPDYARSCEFELQLGVFGDHWSFCSV